MNLIEIGLEHAALRRDVPAFSFLDSKLDLTCTLTYEQLDIAARAVAAWLQSRCGPDGRVLLVLPSGPAFVKAFFGCIYAGVAAIPASAALGTKSSQTQRLKGILRDAEPHVVLTDQVDEARVRACLQQLGLEERLANVSDVPEALAGQWRMPSLRSDSMALLQYTSGSTGTPRGVMVTHHNLIANERLIEQCFRHDMRVVVNWLPLYHDMGLIGNVLQSYFRGAHSISMSPMTFLSEPVNWLRAITTYGATTSGSPNFGYQLCVDRISDVQMDSLDLRSWAVAYAGSEPIRAGTLAAFTAKFSRCGFHAQSIVPCYGLAEATLLVSSATPGFGAKTLRVARESLRRARALGGEDEDSLILVSCGTVSRGQAAVIVNPHTLYQCAAGHVGEIWVQHPSVAAGYWNKPEETARVFGVRLAHGTSGGWLRTGDLGFVLDGELYITGRIKDLIIIRGRNHVAHDIEHSVQECDPGLRRDGGAAFGIDLDGDERLVIVQEMTRQGAISGTLNESLDRIRAAVVESHAIEAHEIVLIRPGTLPRTTSGKIRRARTRELYLAGALRTIAAYSPARDGAFACYASSKPGTYSRQSGVEREVGRIVSDLLGFEVSTRANLFTLGMDSLTATRLVSHVNARFGKALDPSVLYEAPTISDLVAQLNACEQAKVVIEGAPWRSDQECLRLSCAQERMWFLHQLPHSRSAYHIGIAIRLSGKLDHEALRRALSGVIARHESLHSVFPAREGRPIARLVQPDLIALPQTDFRSRDSSRQTEDLQRMLDDEVSAPFDLARGPLLRARLARCADEKHLLALTLHHIICDGWSTALIVSELGALYAGEVDPGRRHPPAATIQYSDYVRWQASILLSDGPGQFAFWKARLMGAPSRVMLPVDLMESTVASGRAAAREVTMDSDVVKRLQSLGQHARTTLFGVLLTAVTLLLATWCGQRDIVIGTAVAGRRRAELESVVGLFVNFVPVRLNIRDHATLTDQIDWTRRELLAISPHDSAPFDRIVEAVNPPRVPGQNPLFNIALLYQNFPMSHPDFGEELGATVSQVPSHAALLDLRFIAEIRDDRLAIACEYDVGLFSSRTIEALLAGLELLLQRMGEDSSESREATSLVPIRPRAHASEPRDRKPLRLVVAANFVAEPIEPVLRFWSEINGFAPAVEFAPYDQIFQQLLDGMSLLRTQRDSFGVILLSVSEWLRNLITEPAAVSHAQTLRRNAEGLVDALRAVQSTRPMEILVCLCPAFAVATEDSVAVRETLDFLSRQLVHIPGIYCLSHEDVILAYPVAKWIDDYASEKGHTPFTGEFFTALGTAAARRVTALRREAAKVIVMDCDDTLWEGICGEVGPDGIRVTQHHAALQEFLVHQHDSGMLLCLCSRNNPADIEAVFRSGPVMPLRESHLVARRIGWAPKSEAIAGLAEELNLALDAFVFIDDSALECAEVAAAHPEVTVLCLPERTSERRPFLENAWIFDRVVVTQAGRERTTQYMQNRERRRALATHSDIGGFLATLELRVDVEPMRAEHVERVAELTQRTNQFNLSPSRLAQSAVRGLLSQETGHARVIFARDRFGDYGLVGALFLREEAPSLVVEGFLLSCRVLGRRVEYRVLNALGRLAQERGLCQVECRARQTERNAPALQFLQGLGMVLPESSRDSLRCVVLAEEAVRMEGPVRAVHVDESESLATMSLCPRPAPRIDAQRIAGALRWVPDIAQAIASRYQRERPRDATYITPGTTLEAELAAIWAGMLGLDKVGIEDDFFNIGGRSLIATQLTSRVRTAYGVDVRIEEFLDRPTVAAMAAIIQVQRDARDLSRAGPRDVMPDRQRIRL